MGATAGSLPPNQRLPIANASLPQLPSPAQRQLHGGSLVGGRATAKVSKILKIVKDCYIML
uniref:Uncharacterized protein n=1 Tax=Oryza glumipatula TaxID=40148 RepID=A0A0E0A9V9_9ORYZ